MADQAKEKAPVVAGPLAPPQTVMEALARVIGADLDPRRVGATAAQVREALQQMRRHDQKPVSLRRAHEWLQMQSEVPYLKARRGNAGSLSPKQLELLRDWMLQHPADSVEDIRAHWRDVVRNEEKLVPAQMRVKDPVTGKWQVQTVAEPHKLDKFAHVLYRAAGRLGMRYQTAKLVDPKSGELVEDEKSALRRSEAHEFNLMQRTPGSVLNDPGKLAFLDETTFQLNEQKNKAWGPVGQPPVLYKQKGVSEQTVQLILAIAPRPELPAVDAEGKKPPALMSFTLTRASVGFTDSDKVTDQDKRITRETREAAHEFKQHALDALGNDYYALKSQLEGLQLSMNQEAAEADGKDDDAPLNEQLVAKQIQGMRAALQRVISQNGRLTGLYIHKDWRGRNDQKQRVDTQQIVDFLRYRVQSDWKTAFGDNNNRALADRLKRVLVWDNAVWHGAQPVTNTQFVSWFHANIQSLCGFQNVVYVPPRAMGKNPVEAAIAYVKREVRAHCPPGKGAYQVDELEATICRALARITNEMVVNWTKACGYGKALSLHYGETCRICHNPIRTDAVVDCKNGHPFHRQCIDRWFAVARDHLGCPTCRAEMDFDTCKLKQRHGTVCADVEVDKAGQTKTMRTVMHGGRTGWPRTPEKQAARLARKEAELEQKAEACDDQKRKCAARKTKRAERRCERRVERVCRRRVKRDAVKLAIARELAPLRGEGYVVQDEGRARVALRVPLQDISAGYTQAEMRQRLKEQMDSRAGIVVGDDDDEAAARQQQKNKKKKHDHATRAKPVRVIPARHRRFVGPIQPAPLPADRIVVKNRDDANEAKRAGLEVRDLPIPAPRGMNDGAKAIGPNDLAHYRPVIQNVMPLPFKNPPSRAASPRCALPAAGRQHMAPPNRLVKEVLKNKKRQ